MVFKLDRLRYKEGRYESQKSLLEKCITGKFIPNGTWGLSTNWESRWHLPIMLVQETTIILKRIYERHFIPMYNNQFYTDRWYHQNRKTENELTTLLEKKTHGEVNKQSAKAKKFAADHCHGLHNFIQHERFILTEELVNIEKR